MSRRGGLRLAALLLLAPAPALGQRAQWTDMVYVPGRWGGVPGRLVPATTRNAQTDSLALVMRVDYFANPPRWRAEVRRSADGRTFGEPDVLLGNAATVLVVTRLGTTPLERHALGGDSLVRAAAGVMDAGGRRRGVANGRLAEPRADGTVFRVAFRRSARAPQFDDRLLDPRNASAGAQLISSRLTSVGDQRSAGVVATAGARGVDRVRTPGGEVPVRPDTTAVLRMEAYEVGAMRLEDFMRLGRLGPYKPDSAAAAAAPAARPDSAVRVDSVAPLPLPAPRKKP